MFFKDKSRSPNYALIAGLAAILCLGFGAAFFFASQDLDALREKVVAFLKHARGTPWGLPLVVLTYITGGLVVFPVTVLNLATSMVFGPLWGFVYGLAGALSSAATVFTIGSIGRRFGLKALFSGKRAKKVDKKLEKSGVMGIAMLGFVPIAPFSLINLCAGLSSVHFLQFIAGVALALLPGGITRSVLGDSLMKIFLNPSPQTLAYVLAGLVLWALMLVAIHFGLKKFGPSHAED